MLQSSVAHDAGLPQPAFPIESSAEDHSEAPYEELPKWYAYQDPLQWYVAEQQLPVRGFHQLPEQLYGTRFPGRKVAKVIAYELGNQYGQLSIGADCDVLARDGTLCPQVLYPGKVLSPAQQAQLLAIAESPPRYFEHRPGRALARATTRCGQEVTTAFVFYDSREVPVGLVNLHGQCQSWQLVPAPRDTWRGLAGMRPEESAVLERLCQELELDTCKAPLLSAAKMPQEPPRALALRLLPAVLQDRKGYTNGQSLAHTTSIERQRLCLWAWRGATVATTALHGSAVTPGTRFSEDRSPLTLQFLSLQECVTRFPNCEETVEESMDALTKVLLALSLSRVTAPTRCVFGIAVDPFGGANH